MSYGLVVYLFCSWLHLGYIWGLLYILRSQEHFITIVAGSRISLPLVLSSSELWTLSWQLLQLLNWCLFLAPPHGFSCHQRTSVPCVHYSRCSCIKKVQVTWTIGTEQPGTFLCLSIFINTDLINTDTVSPADTKSLHQKRRHWKRKWQNLIKTNKNANWALIHVLHLFVIVMWSRGKPSCSESAHGSHVFCTFELYFNDVRQLSQCLCVLFVPFVHFIAFNVHI